MELQLPRGMRDIGFEEYMQMERVREAFVEACRIFNFKLMEPSPIEMLSTLEAKSGEAIRNEIYFFKDKSGRDLGLRFDLTVGVTRYVVSQRGLPLPARVGSFGGMFRYDEPQYGRYRWFYQWNAEIFGPKTIDAEAEIIDFTSSLLRRLGLSNAIIRVGDRRLAEGFIRKSLKEEDGARVSEMLRMLDKVGKKSREEIIEEAKDIEREMVVALLEFAELKGDPDTIIPEIDSTIYGRAEMEGLVELLDARGVQNLEISTGLVRGLDYYSGIVFEVFEGSESKLGALAGGGRYDILPRIFGRSEIGAVGVAGGIERMMMAMSKVAGGEGRGKSPLVYVAYADASLKGEVISMAKELREGSIACSYELGGRSLKKQFESAASLGVDLLVLIAPSEFSRGELVMRDMKSGEESTVKRSSALEFVKSSGIST